MHDVSWTTSTLQPLLSLLRLLNFPITKSANKLKSGSSLRKHLTNHTIICSQKGCDFRFETKELLSDHVSETHNLKCTECKESNSTTYNSLETLKFHMEKIHAVICKVCQDQLKFNTQAELDAHTKDCHFFECTSCDATFDTSPDYANHLLQVHTFICSNCATPTTFDNQNALDHHAQLAHTFSCKDCTADFVTIEALVAHVQQDHTFRCSTCFLVVNTNESLLAHIQQVHSAKCTKCVMAFNEEEGLERHLQSAHVFKCTKCALVFDNMESLVSHVQSGHTFNCTNCVIIFDTKEGLHAHVKEIHTFKCAKCVLIFDSNETVATHVLQAHTLECSECGLVFDTPELLVAHNFGHRYRCGKCSESFASEMGYETHKQVFHPVEVSTHYLLLKILESGSYSVTICDIILESNLPISHSSLSACADTNLIRFPFLLSSALTVPLSAVVNLAFFNTNLPPTCPSVIPAMLFSNLQAISSIISPCTLERSIFQSTACQALNQTKPMYPTAQLSQILRKFNTHSFPR